MQTLKQIETFEDSIKRSRFIAIGGPVTSAETALSFIDQQRHPDAGHHCWAYRIGQAYRFSDDGEPAGTAGKPILLAMERQSIDCAIILVIRYFGGIKLGTGGLMRAYGGSAAALIRQSELIELHDTETLTCSIDFAAVDTCQRFLASQGISMMDMQYTDKGVTFTTDIRVDQRVDFKQSLTEILQGNIDWL